MENIIIQAVWRDWRKKHTKTLTRTADNQTKIQTGTLQIKAYSSITALYGTQCQTTGSVTAPAYSSRFQAAGDLLWI
jgi:hypothetical protein